MRKESKLSGFGFAATMLATVVATIVIFANNETRAAGAMSGDTERGRLLYENHCMVCHTSVVHVREQRKATSRAEIQGWIWRWQEELKLQWGTPEVNDVTEHLNDRYYQLKNES